MESTTQNQIQDSGIDLTVEDVTTAPTQSLFIPKISSENSKKINQYSLEPLRKKQSKLPKDSKKKQIQWVGWIIHYKMMQSGQSKRSYCSEIIHIVGNILEAVLEKGKMPQDIIIFEQQMLRYNHSQINQMDIFLVLEYTEFWFNKFELFEKIISKIKKSLKIENPDQVDEFVTKNDLNSSFNFCMNIMIAKHQTTGKTIQALKDIGIYSYCIQIVSYKFEQEDCPYYFARGSKITLEEDEEKFKTLLEYLEACSNGEIENTFKDIQLVNACIKDKSSLSMDYNLEKMNAEDTFYLALSTAAMLSSSSALTSKIVSLIQKHGVITTSPKIGHPEDFNCYHRLYPTKQLWRMPLRHFGSDLSVLLVESINLKLIDFTLHIQRQHKKKKTSRGLNELYSELRTPLATKDDSVVIKETLTIEDFIVKELEVLFDFKRSQLKFLKLVAREFYQKFLKDIIFKEVIKRQLLLSYTFSHHVFYDEISQIIYRPFAHFYDPSYCIYSYSNVSDYSKHVVYAFQIEERVRMVVNEGPNMVHHALFDKVVNTDLEEIYSSYKLENFIERSQLKNLAEQINSNRPTVVVVFNSQPASKLFLSLIKNFMLSHLKNYDSSKNQIQFTLERPEVCQLYAEINQNDTNSEEGQEGKVFEQVHLESLARYVQWPLYELIKLWDFQIGSSNFDFKERSKLRILKPERKAIQTTNILKFYFAMFGFFKGDLEKGVSPILPIMCDIDEGDTSKIDQSILGGGGQNIKAAMEPKIYEYLSSYLREASVDSQTVDHSCNAILPKRLAARFDELNLLLKSTEQILYLDHLYKDCFELRSKSDQKLEEILKQKNSIADILENISEFERDRESVYDLSVLIFQMKSPLFLMKKLNIRRTQEIPRKQFYESMFTTFGEQKLKGRTFYAKLFSKNGAILKVIVNGTLVGTVSEKNIKPEERKSLKQQGGAYLLLKDIDYKSYKCIFEVERRPKQDYLNQFLKYNRILSQYQLEEKFVVVHKQDLPNYQTSKLKLLNFVPRRHKSTYFKNISSEDLTKVLQTMKCVFRPKPEHTDDFLFSWVIGDEVIVNETIDQLVEENQLHLRGQVYKGFEDLVLKYYTPKKAYINKITKHALFSQNFSLQDKRNLLEDQEAMNQPSNQFLVHNQRDTSNTKILEKFIFSKRKPGYLGMVYFIEGDYSEELIEVKFDKMIFHDLEFENFDEIDSFVQEGFGSAVYQGFLDEKKEMVIKEKKDSDDDEALLAVGFYGGKRLPRPRDEILNANYAPSPSKKKLINNKMEIEEEGDLGNDWGVQDTPSEAIIPESDSNMWGDSSNTNNNVSSTPQNETEATNKQQDFINKIEVVQEQENDANTWGDSSKADNNEAMQGEEQQEEEDLGWGVPKTTNSNERISEEKETPAWGAPVSTSQIQPESNQSWNQNQNTQVNNNQQAAFTSKKEYQMSPEKTADNDGWGKATTKSNRMSEERESTNDVWGQNLKPSSQFDDYKNNNNSNTNKNNNSSWGRSPNSNNNNNLPPSSSSQNRKNNPDRNRNRYSNNQSNYQSGGGSGQKNNNDMQWGSNNNYSRGGAGVGAQDLNSDIHGFRKGRSRYSRQQPSQGDQLEKQQQQQQQKSYSQNRQEDQNQNFSTNNTNTNNSGSNNRSEQESHQNQTQNQNTSSTVPKKKKSRYDKQMKSVLEIVPNPPQLVKKSKKNKSRGHNKGRRNGRGGGYGGGGGRRNRGNW